MISKSEKNEIIVADKFPFTYFASDYDLEFSAAFTGCSTSTNASAKTIAYLIDKVKEKNITLVFYIELSNQNVANAIIEETNINSLELHSAHNVTLDDFNSGKTYYDFMLSNHKNLTEALK